MKIKEKKSKLQNFQGQEIYQTKTKKQPTKQTHQNNNNNKNLCQNWLKSAKEKKKYCSISSVQST